MKIWAYAVVPSNIDEGLRDGDCGPFDYIDVGAPKQAFKTMEAAEKAATNYLKDVLEEDGEELPSPLVYVYGPEGDSMSYESNSWVVDIYPIQLED